MDKRPAVRFLRRAVGALVASALVFFALCATASAAECTDTWTGPAEGSWTTAANWSAGHVPGEADVACIGSGKTVNVSSGTNKVGVLQGEGSVVISGSTLELRNTSEASTIRALTMGIGATLSGPATLRISGTLSWPGESTMAGSGSTILLPGASATTTLGFNAKLKQRRFVNEGTFNLSSGDLREEEGAEFLNAGTFAVKSTRSPMIEKGTGAASYVNTGTFQKTAGASSTNIQVGFENKGTVSIQNGRVNWTAGGSSSAAGKWEAATGCAINFSGGAFSLGGTLSGPIGFLGSSTTVTLASASMGKAQLELENLSLSIPSESVSLAALTMRLSATLTGPGALKISESLTWANESKMTGTGTTVLLPGATASTTLGGNAKLEGRSFVNEGTFTANSGTLLASGGATFTNVGTLQKTTGSGTVEVQVPVENKGTVNARSGTLALKQGGSSSAAGLWEGTEGGLLSLAAGTFNLANTSLAGAVAIRGSTTTVNAEGLSSKSGSLEVESGTLVVSGATTTLFGLTMKLGGLVKGSGNLQVSSSLSWAGESTMTGAGATVLLSGATASTTLSGNAKVIQHTFVNEGTFTMESGTLAESEGALFQNAGTFTANTTQATAVSKGTGGGTLYNTGTFQRTAGAGAAAIEAFWDNEGTVKSASSGLTFKGGGVSVGGSVSAGKEAPITFGGGEFVLGGGSLAGPVTISGSPTVVLFEGIEGDNANVTVAGATLTQGSEGTTLEALTIKSASTVDGGGTLGIWGTFTWANEGTMSGSGDTVILPGATGLTTLAGSAHLQQRRIINEGTFTMEGGTLAESEGAQFFNEGTYNADTHNAVAVSAGAGTSSFINTGTLQRTAGLEETTVEPAFENQGTITETKTHINILDPEQVQGSEKFGNRSCSGDPVECATGDFTESQSDYAIGGRGVGLNLTRTYSAQLAAATSSPGAFGYGWSASFSDHLTVEEAGAKVTLTKSNGSTIPYTRTSGTAYAGPAWSRETLTGGPESGYTFTALNQSTYRFSGSGRLETITDRNGNETALAYDEAGHLKTVTDPAGRQLTFTYKSGGQVESVEDPLGHLVKYAYEGGKLVSVTMPGEESPRWQFKYDASHRITEVIDGRGGKTTNEYDGSGRVVSQTDPAGRTLAFKYEPFHTTITNKATGAVTDKWFTSSDEPFRITYGYGTPQATTTTFAYNVAGQLTRRTDGNGHATTYGYDAEGNRTSEKDAAGHETKWTYNAAREVVLMTTPRGETTTIKRDHNGNVESVSRPAPGEATQTTGFKYDEHGQLQSLTDPLERTWSFGYDAYGDPTSETDPLGHTQTLGYDKDSRLISSVSPRGNLEGAEPAEFETTVERDAQGRPLKVTDPLGHATKYSYDPNGNLASATDAKGHTTKYTYNGDNERTKVEKPNGAILETGYDGAGSISSQTDANEHTTTYARNVLEQPVEVTDPLGRKALREYDAAGNLTKVTDPAERTTSYSYDAANRLTGVNYSEEATPDASFEYNADGQVTAIGDGTGESSFAYDQLGRLTESKNGHGEAVKYSYDLGEEQTGIVYPNGKEVSRAYDKAGRLESLGDWLGGSTSFSYDADSNLTAIGFPAASGNADEYAYDRASQISEAKFKKGAETLASLTYTRDALGQVEAEARTGLPGPEELSYGYDEANRLVKAGSESFEYDPADNLTKGIGSTNAYDAASQLETGTGLTYSYDKLGERTKATPGSGPASTYGYDQAGELTSISRPEEGEVPAISETLAYDATGLLASKTTGLTTRHFAWDASGELPLLLSDGQRSYLYGPGGLPVEQINSEEEPTYLHHDQLGSTRMLTGASGETSAAFSYAPFGGLEGSTGTATTPLGFAGQYTDAETGLQYLRARFYDPATGQFLSRDPIEGLTRQPYSYARQNPLNLVDPSGLVGEVTGGGCAVGEVVDPLGGCIPGAAGGAAVEVTTYGGGAAFGWLLSALEEDSAESSGDEAMPCPSAPPNFEDATQPPGPGWEWKGNGPPGSGEGSWYNPDTKESLYPDLEHPDPYGPHYDYLPRRHAPGSRVYPDGTIEPKKPN
jgi:RHS repeat-associated protein